MAIDADPRFLFDFNRYPYLTEDLPAVTGVMRRELHDFQVDELPAFPAEGAGDHLLVHIEKEDLTTRRVVDWLREALALGEDDIGHAGLKDRRALTRQWLSLPASAEAQLDALTLPEGLRLLERSRHSHKLQEGHLAGNRFRILLREPAGTAEMARAVFERLAAQGVPNYFGPQRFGRERDNAARGLQLIRKGRGRSKRWLDKLLINSLQSLVFNAWLAERLREGLFDHVLEGDIAEKRETGGKFLVGDVEAEQPRAQAYAISPTGPLLGKKYHEAQGPARALEDRVLAGFELSREDFFGSPGSRRAARVPLEAWRVTEAPEGLWVEFTLPKGAFATAVLRELMKTNPEAVGGAEEGA